MLNTANQGWSRIGSMLHGGFDLPTGIWARRFAIKSIQLAMYTKSQSDEKNSLRA